MPVRRAALSLAGIVRNAHFSRMDRYPYLTNAALVALVGTMAWVPACAKGSVCGLPGDPGRDVPIMTVSSSTVNGMTETDTITGEEREIPKFPRYVHGLIKRG